VKILYAPIIEPGHDVQKRQKCGLREALARRGEVREVDYCFSKESISEAALDFKPDLSILQIHAWDAVSREDLATIGDVTAPGPMVCWDGDVWWDTQLHPKYIRMLRDFFDLHLCVNASLILPLAREGIEARYWQNSFESGIVDNELRSSAPDAVFVGNNYSEYRLELARRLRERGVGICGRGWPQEPTRWNFADTLYDYHETGKIYRGTKIAIADNQYPQATGFCSDRIFMAMAAGNCMVLHQYVNEMEKWLGFVDGVHYVSWRDFGDLQEKISYYLTYEEERRKIAEAGTALCRSEHSFDARVAQLFRFLGLEGSDQ